MACSLSQRTRRTASPQREPLERKVWVEHQRDSSHLQRQKPSSRNQWSSPHRSQVGTVGSLALALGPAVPHPSLLGLLSPDFPSPFPQKSFKQLPWTRVQLRTFLCISSWVSGRERDRTKMDVAWASGGWVLTVVFNLHLID